MRCARVSPSPDAPGLTRGPDVQRAPKPNAARDPDAKAGAPEEIGRI